MDKNKHLEKLREMRERAGIIFKKSFNCQDAEKNIHLVDSETFFKKYKKRLFDMGYLPSDDFSFDIIRHRLPWAERHHVGKSYSWKYFYSTTFTIEPEMIDFLERHLFIFKKENTTIDIEKETNTILELKKAIKQLPNKKNQSLEESIIKAELRKEVLILKLKILNQRLSKLNKNTKSQAKLDFEIGINRLKSKLENLEQRILKLKQENDLK